MHRIFREIKNAPFFSIDTKLDFPPHIHEDVELVYVLDGVATAVCDGQEFTLQPGNFFIVFPHQVHQYLECIGSYYLAVFKAKRLQHYSSQLTGSIPERGGLIIPDSDTKERLQKLLELAIEEFEANGDTPAMDGYFTALVGGLLRNFTTTVAPASRDCLSDLLIYCSEHYREPLTVESVSRELHISCSHISHTFSQRLNMGFGAYIHALRLSEAVELLTEERYSVTEVAFRVGYDSLRTFNRVFRKQYGMSPKDYRNNK